MLATSPIAGLSLRRAPRADAARPSRAARLQGLALLEQPHLQNESAIDHVAIRGLPPTGATENELGSHDALDVDAVDHLLDVRQDLTREFQFAEPQRAAPARRAEPAKEEAHELPQRVEPQAARHDRVVLEVAEEKPQVGLHVEFGANHALAVLAAVLPNLRDAVEHQHRRQRQLGIAGPEQFAATAGKQVLVLVTVTLLRHRRNVSARAGCAAILRRNS